MSIPKKLDHLLPVDEDEILVYDGDYGFKVPKHLLDSLGINTEPFRSWVYKEERDD